MFALQILTHESSYVLDERLNAAETSAKAVRDKIDAISQSSQRIAGVRREKLASHFVAAEIKRFPSRLGV